MTFVAVHRGHRFGTLKRERFDTLGEAEAWLAERSTGSRYELKEVYREA